MNPRRVPADPMPAMANGGTFVRPGALAWGGTADAGAAAGCAVEDAVAAAAKDPELVSELLDTLRKARLWLPLPDDGPVTDGSAVLLPTVTYLGAEFVPAFTSAERMVAWPLNALPPPRGQRMPHIVVPAAELARLLPPGMGIALNPGAETSVPVYPEGIGYLAGRAPRGHRRGRTGRRHGAAPVPHRRHVPRRGRARPRGRVDRRECRAVLHRLVAPQRPGPDQPGQHVQCQPHHR